jgi:hypothetical protein
VQRAFGLLLLALGCDSLADPAPSGDGARPAGVGGTMQVPPSQGGTISIGDGPPFIVGPAALEPEPEPEWCTVASREGASFCEVREGALSYCVPAPAPMARGAPGRAGAAGADAGAAGADAGAGGAAGADAGAAECPSYDHPPLWVYDLLLECVAHCSVVIANSERQLDGSCCYVASSVYGGR